MDHGLLAEGNTLMNGIIGYRRRLGTWPFVMVRAWHVLEPSQEEGRLPTCLRSKMSELIDEDMHEQ